MPFNRVEFGFEKLNYKSFELEDGTRFYYDPKESPRKYYPSVTTVLQDYKKDVLVAWRKRVGEDEAKRISKKATVRGTAFHSIVERYLKNETPESFYPDFNSRDKILFRQTQKILDKHISNIYLQETQLISKYLGVVGTVDLIAEWDGVLSVIDFKGSNKTKKEEWIHNYFMQTSAYAYAFWEMTWERLKKYPKQIVVVIADDQYTTTVYKKKSGEFLKAFKDEKDKYMKVLSKKILTLV